jgi:outer membrane protein assembly factor BamD
MAAEFTEKYPNSKMLKEAQGFKKDSERGIIEAKKVIASQQTQTKQNKEDKPEELNNDRNE